MWKDPIVEEVRRIRDQYASQLGFNIQRICQDIQKRQALAGKKTVSFPPRPPVKTGKVSDYAHNVLEP